MDTETKLDQILKIVTMVQQDVVVLKERVAKLEDRMTKLEDRMTKLEDRMTKLENSVFLIETGHGDKLSALFDAREANEDAHKRIEKAIENLKSEIQATLFNHEKRISKLEGNLVPSF